eukprot:4597364-Prymnesium_polylepis.2
MYQLLPGVRLRAARRDARSPRRKTESAPAGPGGCMSLVCEREKKGVALSGDALSALPVHGADLHMQSTHK